MNCFNKVIFLHFYNELKFNLFVQRWKNALAITWYQNFNFVKSGYSNFVLSTTSISIDWDYLSSHQTNSVNLICLVITCLQENLSFHY